jgi:hypothetical protein
MDSDPNILEFNNSNLPPEKLTQENKNNSEVKKISANKLINTIEKSPLENFIEALAINKASLEDVAQVLADALYATDKTAEPDYTSRIKAAEMILKALRLLGPQEQLVVNNNSIHLNLMSQIRQELIDDGKLLPMERVKEIIDSAAGKKGE